MTPNAHPTLHSMIDDAEHMRLFIPSKTFLLGEYAALQNGSAILAATTPCFEVEFASINFASKTEDSQNAPLFHPNSPAGHYLISQSKQNANNDVHHRAITAFRDPYHGGGGFGGSTAEFIAAYYSQRPLQHPDPLAVREAYRLHTQSDGEFRPSGYDILAQCTGKLCLMTNETHSVESIDWPFQDIGFILFKTNQKIQTHVHLNTLKSLDCGEFNCITQNAIDALIRRNSAKFIQAVSNYADELREHQFTCVETLAILSQINKHPYSHAAKGCGGLGADVIAIFCDHQHKKNIIHFAKLIGLNPISDDSELHTGAAWHTRRD